MLTRRAMPWAAVVGSMVVTLAACGGGAGDSTAEPPATSAPVGAVAPAADPCELVPLVEWESATELSGLQLDRDGPKTCDVLDDANRRVAGSMQLYDPSSFDDTRRLFKTEAVSGVGDDAFWIGSGQLLMIGDSKFAAVWIGSEFPRLGLAR